MTDQVQPIVVSHTETDNLVFSSIAAAKVLDDLAVGHMFNELNRLYRALGVEAVPVMCEHCCGTGKDPDYHPADVACPECGGTGEIGTLKLWNNPPALFDYVVNELRDSRLILEGRAPKDVLADPRTGLEISETLIAAALHIQEGEGSTKDLKVRIATLALLCVQALEVLEARRTGRNSNPTFDTGGDGAQS